MGRRACLVLQVLADEPEEHAVDPLAVAPVRLALDAFPKEARAFRVLDGALVETIDLELEPVVVEVEQEVALEESRRLVRKPAPPEVRMHRQAAQVRDPAALVRDVEAHHPGPAPLAVLFDLDHEPARLLR